MMQQTKDTKFKKEIQKKGKRKWQEKENYKGKQDGKAKNQC